MAILSMENDNWPPGTLLETAPVSLSGWYADPPESGVASAWLAQACAARQAYLRAGRPCFQLQLLDMICRHWLGDNPEMEFVRLPDMATDDRERALLELVRGQLLASRKLHGAMAHLRHGFHLAAPLLGAAEYFELLRRHELLGRLSFTAKTSTPQALATLITEAAVIEKLCPVKRERHGCTHLDTTG